MHIYQKIFSFLMRNYKKAFHRKKSKFIGTTQFVLWLWLEFQQSLSDLYSSCRRNKTIKGNITVGEKSWRRRVLPRPHRGQSQMRKLRMSKNLTMIWFTPLHLEILSLALKGWRKLNIFDRRSMLKLHTLT